MKKNIRSIWAVMLLAAVFSLVACTKEKSIEKADPTASQENSWRFTQGTKLYTGSIDTAMVEEINGIQIFSLLGPSTDGLGVFELAVGGTALLPGEYVSPFAAMYYEDNEVLFESDPLEAGFKVNITSIDSIKVTGTFSGKVLDSVGAKVDIISGSFSANL